jgi:hypothetical protein
MIVQLSTVRSVTNLACPSVTLTLYPRRTIHPSKPLVACLNVSLPILPQRWGKGGGDNHSSMNGPVNTYMDTWPQALGYIATWILTGGYMVRCIYGHVNPLRPTRRWTDDHFCRFLTVLEYSPIGEKFPPTIAPRTLYTVQKKKLENFQNFFCFESF